MVGEVRDRETADIAIQAALTGHMVFSTLHTNDAPGGLARLIDMGVEPFLIASSVVGIVAQRLVRAICLKCKTTVKPSELVAQQLGLAPGVMIARGAGCDVCKKTGYKGRIGIYEVMPMSDAIRERVVARAASHVIRDGARESKMRTLYEDGLIKVVAGQTTMEEVLRVTQLE
jgi:type II secretory ATPase GspE/PulE/Tfp pilus assembly ATPase PilB-like protein